MRRCSTQGQDGRSAPAAGLRWTATGVGKTALLGYATQRARTAWRCCSARGIESEAQIPFASLLELLRPALPLLSQLAAPQAAALEQAFALRPGRSQDRFAVAAATLGLLAACAEQQQLMLLLDDIQWFDAPSSEALRFALRRLDADPLVAILAVRSGHRSLLDGTEIETVALDGLSATEARLLRSDLPDAAMQRLIAATDGNPLALLQLAPGPPEELALAPGGCADARVRASVCRLPAPRRCARRRHPQVPAARRDQRQRGHAFAGEPWRLAR